MAWENRGRRRVMYRSVKVNGKVQKRYVGSGALAQIFERLESLSREDRKRRIDLRKDQSERLKLAEKVLEIASSGVDSDTNRSETGAKPETPENSHFDPATLLASEESTDPLEDTMSATFLDGLIPEMQALLVQAHTGDQAALVLATEQLGLRPGAWSNVSDMVALAESAWIGAIAGGNQLVAVGLRRRIEEMRAEFLAEGGSALERLLIDRLLCCWLQVMAMEIVFEQSGAAADEKKRNGAANRFDKAAKALVEIRRAPTRHG